MEDKPLKKSRRATTLREPTTDDERYIQDEFKDFDFKAREAIEAVMGNREALLKEALEREQRSAGGEHDLETAACDLDEGTPEGREGEEEDDDEGEEDDEGEI